MGAVDVQALIGSRDLAIFRLTARPSLVWRSAVLWNGGRTSGLRSLSPHHMMETEGELVHWRWSTPLCSSSDLSSLFLAHRAVGGNLIVY